MAGRRYVSTQSEVTELNESKTDWRTFDANGKVAAYISCCICILCLMKQFLLSPSDDCRYTKFANRNGQHILKFDQSKENKTCVQELEN